MNLNIPQTDTKKAKEGTWIEYLNEVSIKVARSDNDGYVKALNTAVKEYGKKISEMDDEFANSLICGIIAEHILLDWKGLKDGDGNDIPYSVEFATELLMDESYDHFYDFVVLQSKRNQNFYTESYRDTIKK